MWVGLLGAVHLKRTWVVAVMVAMRERDRENVELLKEVIKNKIYIYIHIILK